MKRVFTVINTYLNQTGHWKDSEEKLAVLGTEFPLSVIKHKGN